jgi:intracellular septation protein A
MRGLLTAFRPVASDMASSLLLVILLAFHADVIVATVASVALGVGQMAWMKARRHEIAPLHYASLVLVLIFGAAGLAFQDIRFLMAKPTVVELVIAAVMLKRGWMLRYLPAEAEGARDLMIAWGYVWAGFMALLAAANLVVAIWMSDHWVAFKATVPTFGPLALFVIQYTTMRWTVMRRERAAAAAAQAA